MIDLKDVQAAARVVERFVRPTPHLYSYTLSQLLGGSVHLKPENLQRTGSFKLRGACHKLTSLGEEEKRAGVIAASAGNHAQGVALASQLLGLRATVVMPEVTPINKVQRTASAGAEVILHGGSVDEALAFAKEEGARRHLTFIHGYDDPKIIAGQGTVGLEIVQDLPDCGTIVVPVGGGGLIAGIALACKGVLPRVRVVGVQAAGCPSAVLALEAGHPVTLPAPKTIADGIRVGRVGDLPFEIIREKVDELVTVEDEEISRAIVVLMEKSKLVVEAAGAVGVAALLSGKIRVGEKPVSLVLSGGNIDTNFFIRMLERGLTHEGRLLLLRVGIVDKPGQLAKVLAVLASQGANVLDVKHYRAGWQLPLEGTELEILLETRDAGHGVLISRRLQEAGYTVTMSGRSEG
ncbi:MAG TPA: threonine ammonia-lyase [Candidatus Polarisedimenticolia bacterium]|jgi:threonine dehydratase|nr:threonine ammonia-lyase [Candidatus Polarisedimenticolia bacterium]